MCELAELCQQPYAVGHSLSVLTGDQYQHSIIPDLIREDNWSLKFVCGYVAARFELDGWAWFDGQLGRCNSDLARAWMFAMLPFRPDVWDRVDEENTDAKRLYWSNVNHWRFDKSAGAVQRCVTELVAVARLANAVEIVCGTPR